MSDAEIYARLLATLEAPRQLFLAAGLAEDGELARWISALDGWPTTDSATDLESLAERLRQLKSLIVRLAELDSESGLGFDPDFFPDGSDAKLVKEISLELARNEDLRAYHRRCGVPLHNSITQIRERLIQVLSPGEKRSQQ